MAPAESCGTGTATGTARAPLGVLCVDDNELVGGTMERWVGHDPRFRWDGWVPDGPAAMKAVEEKGSEIVLLDVDIPGTDTFGVLTDLTRRFPGTKVVMFSGLVAAEMVDRALDGGACGYVTKDEPVTSLMDAVKRVVGGEIVISRTARLELLRR